MTGSYKFCREKTNSILVFPQRNKSLANYIRIRTATTCCQISKSHQLRKDFIILTLNQQSEKTKPHPMSNHSNNLFTVNKRALRSCRRAKKGIFFDWLKRETTQKPSHARGRVLRTIIDEHCDHKQDNVGHHKRRNQPWKPPIEGWVIRTGSASGRQRRRRRRRLRRRTHRMNHVVGEPWMDLNLYVVGRWWVSLHF